MCADTSESNLFPSDSSWEQNAGYGGFQLLHEGVYANVYRASKAGKYFLLKAPRSGDSACLNMLKREYEVSVGLDHPNIISAFTFETVPGIGPCLVMQYVDGEDMATFLRQKPGARVRKKVLLQLLSAVGYLHKRNILHNDLKPENILISRQVNNLKLIDFGLSDDDAHYLAKTPGCTPAFASPELLSGGALDARSDIYSIGKIIRLLFPVRYACIAARCTRKRPGLRYKSVESILWSMGWRRVVNWTLPFLIVLGAAGYCLLPDILRRNEYDTAVGEAERAFRETCAAEGLPPEDIPYMSRDAYLSAGHDKTARKDSLNRIMQAEIGERIVQKEGLEKLDSLFEAYKEVVRKQPFQAFGKAKVTDFAIAYNHIRDDYRNRLKREDDKKSFYTACENRYPGYASALYKIADTLPGYENLSYEEMNFYTKLISKHEPYRPYKGE